MRQKRKRVKREAEKRKIERKRHTHGRGKMSAHMHISMCDWRQGKDSKGLGVRTAHSGQEYGGGWKLDWETACMHANDNAGKQDISRSEDKKLIFLLQNF